MPSTSAGLIRRLLPGAVVLITVAALFLVARIPQASAGERAGMAARYGFTELPIALPAGLPVRDVRTVNPAYEQIRSWISSVGAAIALNDLDGNGLNDDLCLVDTRSDSVVVTPAPGGTARYQPFVLTPAPLPSGPAIAPMGCTPGDFNGDARMDLLVYYWGRTPVLFMGRPGGTSLSPAAYRPTELVPTQAAPDGSYQGRLWNTNAVSVADFDGDGHPDIGIFNYFPDSEVLDPDGDPTVVMNRTMSRARNAGGAHVMRWVSGAGGAEPAANYVEQSGAIAGAVATGWTLGAGSADLDGDLLPELYLANDFGPDHLFHNVSKPGRIAFDVLAGDRTPVTPKSMALGNDSFKGMSIDFGDLRGTGRFDMFVSNITTRWGLQESNFAWLNTAASPQAARDRMSAGDAPFVNDAAGKGLAWSGWGWDAKMADFDNSGSPAIVQATGFIDGSIDRWAWLQELAMSNDLMLGNPQMWPKAGPDDDIAGDQRLAFWAPGADGRFTNLSGELGLDVPTPTRGIAVADTDGDGFQDFAVARQWGAPAFYHNDHPSSGAFLGLKLTHSGGSPAYGAVVRVTTAGGATHIGQLDGGGGHSGKRAFDVFFGLGASTAPVTADISWRDTGGGVHQQRLTLSPGRHDLVLDQEAKEVAK